MPAYRDIEKKKHIQRSQLIFGSRAGRMGGTYNQIERPFCLPNELSGYNLHESIRKDAVDYFLLRRIPWHDGKPYKDPRSFEVINSGTPSNHVCCSQSQCVSSLFPAFMKSGIKSHLRKGSAI